MARNGMFVAVMGTALALLVLGTPVPVQAQSEGMSVRIPFDFNVGDKRLPAGTYVVERRGEALSLKGQGRSHHPRPLERGPESICQGRQHARL